MFKKNKILVRCNFNLYSGGGFFKRGYGISAENSAGAIDAEAFLM